MYSQEDKSKENKSSSAASSVTQKKSSNQGVGLEDNRIGIVQRMLSWAQIAAGRAVPAPVPVVAGGVVPAVPAPAPAPAPAAPAPPVAIPAPTAHQNASAARDAAVGTHGRTVVGAYDAATGEHAVGHSGGGVRRSRGCRLGNCAEGHAASQLIAGGSDVRDIRFTRAIAMRRGQTEEMRVCNGCRQIYGPSRFPTNANFSRNGYPMRGRNPERFRGGRARSPSPGGGGWNPPRN